VAKKENKKLLKQKNNWYHRQNRQLYTRAREAEMQLDQYEKHIADQVTRLTAKYEGIVCYLIKMLGWDGVVDSEVAKWAEDKEYALTAEEGKDGGVVWVPVIRIVGEEDSEDD
jgi:hypothetical protein